MLLPLALLASLTGLSAGTANQHAKLIIAPDWDAINASRDDWTKRWNREVER